MGVTLNAPLSINSGGLSIDSHLGRAPTIQLNAAASSQGNVNIQGSIRADTVTLNAPLDVFGGDLTIELKKSKLRGARR